MKSGTTSAGAALNEPVDLACACATARQAARALTQLYDGWLAGTGLEAPQFALLMTLDKHGAVSQAALGRRYVLDKTTMSRNLKRLEAKGWTCHDSGTVDCAVPSCPPGEHRMSRLRFPPPTPLGPRSASRNRIVREKTMAAAIPPRCRWPDMVNWIVG